MITVSICSVVKSITRRRTQPSIASTTSHHHLNRYLRGDKLPPRWLWEQVKDSIVTSPDEYLLFDDTVADKNYSCAIELVCRKSSGNAHAIIKGIGIVTCVDVNPDTEQFWIIDYRIFDKAGDGKSKLDHMREMFNHTREHKQVPFRIGLMDSQVAPRDP